MTAAPIRALKPRSDSPRSPYTFHPIAEAPRDGRTLVLADETGWLAVAHWADPSSTDSIWASGHLGDAAVEIDFTPTRFADPV